LGPEKILTLGVEKGEMILRLLVCYGQAKGPRKEEQVRRCLEKRYHTTFYRSRTKRTMRIPGGEHAFDLVSSRGSIVGEVKSTRYPHAGKSLPTKVGDMSRDILLLLAVKRSRKRLLVLTNKKFYDFFVQTEQAKIADSRGVKTIFLDT